MEAIQPEASTSTGPGPTSPLASPQHLATFVFDSRLPRARYAKLIEAEGVVHKLVQRLMEKHGGENHLRVCLLITAAPIGDSHVKSVPSSSSAKVFRQEYGRPSAFLTSLPKLVEQFPRPGSRIIKRQWPGFTNETLSETDDLVRERKRKRGSELRFLNGLIGGLELLDRPATDIRHSTSQTFVSLTPSSATPMLDSLCTLAHSDRHSPSSFQRYLIVLASDEDSVDGTSVEESSVLVNDSWDTAWDDQSWEGLTDGVKGREVRCSCVVVGHSKDGQTPSKKFKSLCKQVSGTLIDAPWFTVPPETDVTLSGYSIDNRPSSGATPLLDMASTVGTEQIETPVTNPAIGPDPRSLQAMQNPAMQVRVAQFVRAMATASGGGKIDPQLMQSMLAAANGTGGQVDMSDPRWQQFRQLLQLQQQRQNVAATGSAANNTGVPLIQQQQTGQQAKNATEQNLMAAIQQQRAQQAQGIPQAGPQHNSVPPVTATPSVRPTQQPIWSGVISWAGNPAANGLNIDAMHFTGAAEGVMVQQWPRELQLRNIASLDVTTLTAYAKAKNSPIIILSPSQNSADVVGNAMRYTQLANSLHAKGNMVVIPFAGPDRGIVLFAAPIPPVNAGPNVNRQHRLMGVVCLNVPFPALGSVNPTAPVNQGQVPAPTQMRQQQIQQQVQQQSSVPQSQQQFRPSPALPSGTTNPTFQPQMGQSQQTQHQMVAMAIQQQQQQQHLLQQQQLLLQQQQQQTPQQMQQPPQLQRQQSQSSSFPQAVPLQPNQEIKRGITQQQYQQLMGHAQRIGLNLPPFDHNTIPQAQVQNILSGIRAAEARIKQQQQQQQQQQAQMQQLQQILAQQNGYGGITGHGVGGVGSIGGGGNGGGSGGMMGQQQQQFAQQ
ncbi:hypothetical protein IAR55_002898 [Kwoniella newhampshirensis]|uniref:Mediator of RNA polymerase II transcription subunit 25 n=1 Tax=Kwoniella newhampshirensis TaxID=1651941 RepID=A0AAW0YNX8_9TREE